MSLSGKCIDVSFQHLSNRYLQVWIESTGSDQNLNFFRKFSCRCFLETVSCVETRSSDSLLSSDVSDILFPSSDIFGSFGYSISELGYFRNLRIFCFRNFRSSEVNFRSSLVCVAKWVRDESSFPLFQMFTVLSQNKRIRFFEDISVGLAFIPNLFSTKDVHVGEVCFHHNGLDGSKRISRHIGNPAKKISAILTTSGDLANISGFDFS